MENNFAQMSPAQVRALIREGKITQPTTGMCDGYAQGNLVVLPKELAWDFLLFCQRNPKSCPLLEVADAGSRTFPVFGAGSDIARDIPKYRVYENGVMTGEYTDVSRFFDEPGRELVSFLIGCSFSFESALLEAGVPCEIHEDILYRQWSKLMLNVGLNQVCAVYNVPYRGVQYPGTARDTMLAAMREAQALAAREGVTLTDADISAWMKMTVALNPDGMPSMRQDTLARRPTEVELFAGAMRRLGEKHGVPTPVNDMLYRRIAELDTLIERLYADRKRRG